MKMMRIMMIMIIIIDDATIIIFKIGGKVEMSTQTKGPVLIHKAVQATNPIFMQDDLMRLMYPTLRNQTVDDMVIDLHKHAPLRAMYESRALAKPPNTVMATTSTQKSDISSAFKDHRFYPERRPGHGPKYVKNDLDR